MNTATAFEFDDLLSPISPGGGTRQMPPLPEENIDEMLLFRVLDPDEPIALSQPMPTLPHPVLESEDTCVPASLIRRIEQELREDQCDPRTVFQACRGLTRGSREFEDAYIAARIRSYSRTRKIPIDPLLGTPMKRDEILPEFRPQTRYENPAVPHNPMVVWTLGHLMNHFGIWVTLLLGCQAWASWRIGAFADEFLEGGLAFYITCAFSLMMLFNTCVWFKKRGRFYNAFIFPGAVLFGVALVPVIFLHLRDVVLALQ